jgi:transcriptional regulator of acetoin/glycerol metabolism
MSGGPDTRTLTNADDAREPAAARREPYLFLVLEGHCPLASPVRLSLGDVDEVVLGRGRPRRVELGAVEDRRVASVRVDDGRMSASHARLTKVLRRWMIQDDESRNGTLVNGVAQTRAALADGDVVELGHTFFLFRDLARSGPGEPAILDAGSLSPPSPCLVTLLPAVAQDFARFAMIARSTVPVLLEGETGTGKEVMARALHEISGRAGDFVAVNCGALPRDLVEGELFGHRRGAFSGATEDRPGLVRAADKGTLFLDEIGDLAASAQAALLRVLQEREVRPLGGARAFPVDLRVVAATHRPLDEMVVAGEFRADLLGRIAGHRFTLPPLRARREDLGLLTGALLRRLAPEEAPKTVIQPRAVRALLGYAWPRNVRELEHCLSSALVLAREAGKIELAHLPAAVQRALQGEDEARREEIAALLREHEGNVTLVAKHMGKARMQVQRWLKRYSLDPEQFRR